MDTSPNAAVTPPTPEPVVTLGDLLMQAIATENSREHNRRAVERATAQSSISGFALGAQVAALESGDQWAWYPPVLRLRGFANNEYGLDLTPEAIRRIRGRVCENLDIDTQAADALPIPRVNEVLSEHRADVPVDDISHRSRWLRVGQIASVFALVPGTVSKRCDDGTYVTNGLTGHDRRVDVLSVIRQQLAQLAKQAAPDAE